MNAFPYRLSVVHQRLDDEIRRELGRPRPSSVRLLRLRILRLAVKGRLYARVRRSVVGV